MRKVTLDKAKRGHTLTVISGVMALTFVMLIGVAGAAPYAYITNMGDNTVTIIDTETNFIMDTLNGFNIPVGSAVSPDGTKVYVANSGTNTVSVIRTDLANQIDTVTVGNNPYGVAATPDEIKVYVTNNLDGTVSVIDAFTNTETKKIDVGTNPYGVAVTPDGTKAYVANYGNNSVSVINTFSDTVEYTIDVGLGPKGVAFSPDGTTAYVTNNGDNTVSVIDTLSNTILQNVTVGSSPEGVAVDLYGTKAYVANSGDNNVSVIDTTTTYSKSVMNSVLVGSGPLGVAVSPDGTKVYVANSGDTTVSVIDTNTDSLMDTVPGFNNPAALGQFIGPIPILPVANFSSNTTSGYAPLSVQFNDSSTNVIWFNWNFGDGNTSTQQNPMHTFSTAGNYTVSLTATNANGTNSTSANITVLEKILPVANFSSNVTEGYAPLDVQFTDLSENTTGWYWDFGDGENLTEQNPMHTFSTAGNFTVNLTASNANGTDSYLSTINVSAPSDVHVGRYAYITNSGSHNVSVIDTETNTVITTIPVGNTPWGVAINPDGSYAYVTNSADDNISVIDIATNTVIATVNVGDSPWAVAVNPDETKAYVTNYLSNNVSVINTTNNTVTATVNVGNNPYGVMVNPEGTKVYVANALDSIVSVIDAANNTVTANVSVGDFPYGVAISPDGTKAYIVNMGSGNVSVIDTSSNTVTASVPVGSSPQGVAISPDGTKAYITNADDNNVSVIDTTNYTVTGSVTVGSFPYGVSVSHDGTKVFVANGGGNTVSVIDTANNTVTATVTVGNNPYAFGQFIGGVQTTQPVLPVANFSSNVTSGYAPLDVQFSDSSENADEWYWDFGDGTNSTEQNPMHTFSTAGNFTVNLTASNVNGTDSYSAAINVSAPSGPHVGEYAYITNAGNNTVSVIDTANDTVIATVNVGKAPWGVAVNPDGTNVYVANSYEDNTVSVINIATNTVIATVPVGSDPTGIAVTPDGTKVYVTNWGSDNVSVINTTTNTVTSTVEVGAYPIGVVVNPDGTEVYVADYDDTNVSVIDITNNTVTVTVPVGINPRGVAVSPDGTKVYVTNEGSNNVSVIDTTNNTVTATVPVGSKPIGVAISPDGTKVYAANEYSNTISIIDTSNNTVTDTVDVGVHPYGVAFNLAGTKAYVANQESDNVSVIDTTTNTVTDSVPVGDNPFAFGQFIGEGQTEQPVLPVANFSTNITSGYVPLSVQFTDISENADEWNWDFGDGDNSTEQNPMHTFSAAGNFTVNLTASNANDTDSYLSTINVSAQPVLPEANFSINVISGYAPLSVQFNDSSENATAWHWDFGDGNTSTEPNPMHDFYAIGNYVVNLTARNENGTNSEFVDITVLEQPVEHKSIAYIPSSIDNFVSIIDTSDNSIKANVPVGTLPYGVAVTLDGKKIYVPNYADNTVSVIDAATNNVTAAVLVGSGPFGSAATPNGTKVYVSNNLGTTVSVIDTVTNTVTATVPVGGIPAGIAVNPTGTKVYVTVQGTENYNISVIDTASDAVTANVSLGSVATGIAVSPTGRRVYVTQNDGNVSVIDTASNIIKAIVGVGNNPNGVAVNPTGTRVYVANGGSGTVSVIDTATNNITASVNVGNNPFGVAVTLNGTKVYVANQGSNNVSVIDTATNNVTATVPVGRSPFAIGQFIGPEIVLPVANFSTNVTSGNAPLSVQFNDNSENATELSWDFNDDELPDSFDANPIYVFGSGNHTVNLTASNENGTDSKSITINVTKATPSITWSNPVDITYGTELDGTQLNASASVPGNFTYTPAEGTVLGVGNQTLNVDFTPADAANCTNASENVSINVLQATPEITWNNPQDIVYGTALNGTQLNASASVNGTLVYTPTNGTVLAAGQHTLQVDLTPEDAANYTNASANVSLNVTKVATEITWSNPVDIIYGTALNETQLNASASVPGNFTYTPAQGTVLGVGNHTLQADFTPTDDTNYTSTSENVTINVLQGAPEITWNNPQDIVYGTALNGTQLNAVASTNGTLVYTPTNGTVLGVGQHTLQVDLTPTDAANYTNATKNVTINVSAQTVLPVANFSTNVTSGYAPLSVQFSDSSANATEWNWNFGDGNNSTEQNPMHTFSAAGNYTVNLTASNANSTSSTLANITVLEKILPVANFSSNVTEGYVPLSVQFNDSSENATAWHWDFGDGNNSTQQNPTHTFSAAGNYTVNLTVSNLNGTNSKTAIITVSVIHVKIYKFDTKWGSEGTGEEQFKFPCGIAVDSSGYIYVADQENNRIEKYNSNGTLITKWGSEGTGDGQFRYPSGIAVDSSGNVYVIESSNHRIQKFTSSGNFITKWGSYGTDDGQFAYPWVVAVDSSDNVYVADQMNHRVQKFNSSGAFITKWGSEGIGDGTFNRPCGIEADSSGNIYVADTYNHRIQKFTSNGAFITKWGSFGTDDGRFNYPRGITIDSYGNVYVADDFNHRVQEFTSSGNFITKWGSEGTGDGQFAYPCDVAFESSGDIYVADTGNYRIQRFTPVGPVLANFNSNVTSGNAPLSVQFTDLSENATAWNWDFGDGENSTLQNPMHTFSAAGNYTVNLIASNANGTDSYSATITVSAQQVLPVANFSANVTSGNAPLSVQFSDSSENANAWDWDFGDGNNSTQQNPIHTFSAAGNYTVNLTASNLNGTNSTSANITVLEESRLGANLYLSENALESKHPGSSMNYTLYYQNFGDRIAQNVVLEDVLSSNVEFESASDGGIYNNSTRKVTWNIGSVAPDEYGYRTITARIPLNVSNGTVIPNNASINTSDTESRYDDNEVSIQTLVASQNLPQNVSVEPTMGDAGTPSVYWGEPITFSYHSCESATGVNISIHIDDGQPDIVGNMNGGPSDWNYTTTFYPRTGKATVNYTVYGCNESTVSFSIYVDPAGYIYDIDTGNRIAGASVWLQRPDGAGGWENVPTNESIPVAQPDVNPQVTGENGMYQWDVLNGTYRVHVEATGYEPKNSYAVMVPPAVTDLHVGLVRISPVLPVANFSSNVTSGYVPLSVQFIDLSENVISVSWDFENDGISDSTDRNPAHVYDVPGNYTVNLTASNENGSSSYLAAITVLRATPVITWNNPADIVYGTALNSNQLNALSSVNGTFAYTPAAGTILGIGTQTLHVDFTPTDTANYTNASKDVTINVLNASYSIFKSVIGVDETGDCILDAPRDVLQYRIVVKNEGNVSLTNVNVTDALISLTGPIGNGTEEGVLRPGETRVYTGNYSVTEDDINNGTGYINNTATIRCDELPEKSSSVSQPIVQNAGLAIYKSVTGIDEDGDHIINSLGDTINYLVAVKNYGNVDLTGVSVDDPMVTLIKSSGDHNSPGVLNAGELWVYTGDYTVTQEDITNNGEDGSGLIKNTATVSCNELTNETSTLELPITRIINIVTDSEDINTSAKVYPVANFGTSVTSGYAPLSVQFTDKSQNAASWSWDFNNNGVSDSSERSPVYIYSDPGTYAASLTVSNANGTNSKTETITVMQATGSSDGSSGGNSGGSSGGSSGGFGGSAEPANNVEAKEISQAFIASGKSVKFDFPKNATSVVYLSFDSKKTFGKTTTIVEMLKGKSTFASGLPSDEVYRYVNIWIGNSGFVTNSLENAIVCFKVEKSWIQEKKIDQSSITLNRYSDKKWEQLQTSQSGEDDSYLYFTARTPGFSPFAITGKKTASGTEIKPRTSTQSLEQNSGNTSNLEQTLEQIPEQKNNTSTPAKESKKSPSFEIICGITALLAVFLHRRR